MSCAYVPDAGDIVWLNFDPQTGHEQAGHRPALVLSPAAYNAKTSLMVCCPMTTQIKNYPFEVVIAGPVPVRSSPTRPKVSIGGKDEPSGKETCPRLNWQMCAPK